MNNSDYNNPLVIQPGPNKFVKNRPTSTNN